MNSANLIEYQNHFASAGKSLYVENLIGNTPLLAVHFKFHGERRTIFVKAELHPLEPAESPTLTTGCKVGSHRIQGISDEFIPAICELDKLDEIVTVSDGDSILVAQKLASELGLGVGISSGANFLEALMAREKLGADAVVVTIFCDDNKKYLSTGLVKNESCKEDYLSQHIELFGYQTIRRINQKLF